MQFKKIFLLFVFLIFKAQIFCARLDIDINEALLVGAHEEGVVKPVFQHLFGPKATFQRIAVGVSGGGYRSMISGIGLLSALEKLGLYDCVSYTSGVSGGTWAILPLPLRSLSPIDYTSKLKDRMCSPEKKRNISKLRAAYNDLKLIDWVDLWGAYIGEKILGDLPQQTLTFETIRKNLKQNIFQPFPICTCVIGQTGPSYQWVEVSPFSVYSNYLGEESIPTSALGSKFKAGSVDGKLLPEKSLEFFIGLFGSAFCFSIGDIVNNVCENFIDKDNLKSQDDIREKEKLDASLKKFSYNLLYEGHFFTAKLPNYSLQIPESKMSKDEYLQLIDAGYGCNLPIPPLLRPERNINILIICDASAEKVSYTFSELKKAASVIEKIGGKFPNIHRFKSQDPKIRNLKIFYDEDPSVPMIIYFEHENKFPTTKMSYSETDFDEVYYDSYNTIIKNREIITEAIKKKANVPNIFDIYQTATC